MFNKQLWNIEEILLNALYILEEMTQLVTLKKFPQHSNCESEMNVCASTTTAGSSLLQLNSTHQAFGPEDNFSWCFCEGKCFRYLNGRNFLYSG
ncbi:hypothetical protein SRHO_G00252830 [Serrasalmus rhombeus]